MPLRFATQTDLGLALFALSGATAAHADADYVPYYAKAQGPYYSNVTSPSPAVPVPPRPGQPRWQSATPLFHFNNTIWAAAGASELNYKETVSPIPDSDRGELPSFAAGIDFMTRNNLYLSADGSVAVGNAHYNGALYDSGTGIYDIPYETSTHETVVNVNGKIGQGFSLSDRAMFIPYLDVGFRYWDRKLGAGQGEEYQNYDVLGGVMFEYTPIDRLILSAYGAGGTTFGATMRTSGHDFDLGGSGIEKVGGKIGYDLTKRIELFSTVDYDHFHYVGSPWVLLSSTTEAREPSSRTEDTTLRVGIGYHFR
jgi:hypothetical protein